MATSFVQGRLRRERLVVQIESECAHCGRRINLIVDSDLNWSLRGRRARPLLFEPEIDWRYFRGRHIIDDY